MLSGEVEGWGQAFQIISCLTLNPCWRALRASHAPWIACVGESALSNASSLEKVARTACPRTRRAITYVAAELQCCCCVRCIGWHLENSRSGRELAEAFYNSTVYIYVRIDCFCLGYAMQQQLFIFLLTSPCTDTWLLMLFWLLCYVFTFTLSW